MEEQTVFSPGEQESVFSTPLTIPENASVGFPVACISDVPASAVKDFESLHNLSHFSVARISESCHYLLGKRHERNDN